VKFQLFFLDMGLGVETHAERNSLLRYAKKMHAKKLFPVKTVLDSIFRHLCRFSYFLILKILSPDFYLNFWFFRHYIDRSSLSIMRKTYLNAKEYFILSFCVKKPGKKANNGISVATRRKCFHLVLKDSQDVDLVQGEKFGVKLF